MSVEFAKISSQITAGKSLSLNSAKLAFKDVLGIKNDTALVLNTESVLDEYMYYIRQNAAKISMDDDQIRTFAYNPKALSYYVYGTTELYQLILRLNYLKSASEFTDTVLRNNIWIPSRSNIGSFITEVLNKEKTKITKQTAEVNDDIAALS